ncbi:MAG: hypothetical protein RL033_1898 [Pseudomonadota bacterium]
MLARVLRASFLAGCCALGAGCDDGEPLVLLERSALTGIGSARVDLPLGSLRGGTATLVLSGQPDFTSQTRQLNVSGPDAQRSVFFGSLPAGITYTLELLAGNCRGEVQFVVEPNRTTQVEPQLSCSSEEAAAPDSALSVREPAPAPTAATPECVLIEKIVADPSLQTGNTATSTIEVIPVKGVSLSSVEWSLVNASDGVGLLFSSPSNGLAVGFDCERDGIAGIVAGVSGTRDGKVCRQQGQTQIHCVEQSVAVAPGATPGAAPPVVPAATPPALPPQPPAEPGACGACARDFCAAQLAAVQALPAAEPVLSCVLGSGWSAGDRASGESCGNLDLLSCYCGGTPALECEQLAPAELDGPCREQILSASSCTDSSCVKTSLLDPAQPSGAALSYIRCQQDLCYDLCFNY